MQRNTRLNPHSLANIWSEQRNVIRVGPRPVVRFPLLEMHVAHACNLTCESCSHFSNDGHRGLIDVEEANRWMAAWSGRLLPGMFRLLGGEPTLNPALPELVRLARKHWPRSRIALTTNGFFAHRHTGLGEALGAAGARVLLTIHDRTPEYLAKARPNFELLKKWSRQFGFELKIEESHRRWTRRYRGGGRDVLPFEDGDLRASWQRCPARQCRQLFRGRLWKCSPIAYLQLQKETHPDISAKWDAYLAYQALDPGCTDAALASFLTAEQETICGMCPAAPERFTKRSPLIPLAVIRRGDAAAV